MNRNSRPWIWAAFLLLCSCSCLLAKNGQLRGEYVAMSLTALEDRIGKSHKDEVKPFLLGFNEFVGAVVQRNPDDIILIGQSTGGLPSFTSDELGSIIQCCDLGAMGDVGFSLEAKGGDFETTKLIPRFIGLTGENCIGSAAFRADYLMKKIALGQIPVGVANVRTYAARQREILKVSAGQSVVSRFWFMPDYTPVVISKNRDAFFVVPPTIKVHVETLEVNKKRPENGAIDAAAEEYAKDFNTNWPLLVGRHAELADMVRYVRALKLLSVVGEDSTDAPRKCLTYWRKQHKSTPVAIPKEVDMIEDRTVDGDLVTRIFGGVRLGGITFRLRGNEDQVGAFRSIVLTSRPKDMPLTWRFTIREDMSVVGPGLDKETEKIAQTYADGLDLLYRATMSADAMLASEAYGKFEQVNKLYPDAVEPAFLRATAGRDLALYRARPSEAIPHLETLLNLGKRFPSSLEVNFEIGRTLLILGRAGEAIPALSAVVEVRPDYGPALHALGLANRVEGNKELAKKNFQAFMNLTGQPEELVKVAQTSLSELEGRGEKELTAVDRPNKLRFIVPETWRKLTEAEAEKMLGHANAPGTLLMVYRHPDDPDSNLNVRMQDIKADGLSENDIREAIPALDQAYRKAFKGYEKLEAGSINAAGVKGIQFKFGCDRAGVRLTQSIVTMVKNEKMMTITFTAKAGSFDRCWTECFHPALESMKWQESGAGSKPPPANHPSP